MIVKLIAPKGLKLVDIKTRNEYSEVVCEDYLRDRYALVGSSDDPTIIRVEGESFLERVERLEAELTATKILLQVD